MYRILSTYKSCISCTGTASWRIGDSDEMLVVMWSVPFYKNWYSNWCAVGIMPFQEDTSELWAKMYYGEEVNFKREEFDANIPRLDYKKHPDFTLVAGMGSSPKTNIRVEFLLKKDAAYLED